MLNRIFGVCKNKKLNTIINFDVVTGENIQEHNLHWPEILDHAYRILIVESINNREEVGLKHPKEPETVIEYSNDWREQSRKEKKSIDSVWWYDCWYDQQ